MKKLLKNNKGFTLVELIVVIVILGILAAILVPSLLKWIDKARQTKVQSDAYNTYTVIQQLVANEYANTNPDFSDILTADNLKAETGVAFDEAAFVKAEILRKGSATGTNIFVSDFEYTDIKSSTLLVYDVGNAAWIILNDGSADVDYDTYADGSDGVTLTEGAGTASYNNISDAAGIEITLSGFGDCDDTYNS